MENEILQQVLTELKGIRESQAVLEREVGDVKANQQMTSISLNKLDRNQAVIEQGQARLEKQISAVEETLQTVKNSQIRVELEQFPRIAAALDGTVGGNEKNTEQDRRIEVLENKSEKQDNRILALEYALKAE